MVYCESCRNQSANVVDRESSLEVGERIIDGAIVISISSTDGRTDQAISEADVIDGKRRENVRTWHDSEKACPPYKEHGIRSNRIWVICRFDVEYGIVLRHSTRSNDGRQANWSLQDCLEVGKRRHGDGLSGLRHKPRAICRLETSSSRRHSDRRSPIP